MQSVKRRLHEKLLFARSSSMCPPISLLCFSSCCWLSLACWPVPSSWQRHSHLAIVRKYIEARLFLNPIALSGKAAITSIGGKKITKSGRGGASSGLVRRLPSSGGDTICTPVLTSDYKRPPRSIGSAIAIPQERGVREHFLPIQFEDQRNDEANGSVLGRFSHQARGLILDEH